MNLNREQEGKNFEQILAEAHAKWNDDLSRITVEGGTDAQKTVFYTALYHLLIHPNILQDANGEYPAMESDKIMTTKGDRYTVFSLWDTYRNVHQLLTLVYPERQMEMIRTMLDMYREHGWLPKWEFYDNGCQIGNHTYDHKILTRVGKKEVQKQVSKTNRAVKKVIGINPVVMRPPGGATSSNIKSWVGMPSIIWSIDTLDWKTRDSASTQKAVLNHVKDGDIVLMHDLYKATATASQTIIPELTRRGYQLVTVSELAECRGGMKQNKSYSKFPKKQK